MYGRYRKSGYKKKSSTKSAYYAGLKKGKAIAYSKKRRSRW